jgi:mannosyl-3-phosphoglycerate phosphatase family protein
MSLPDVPWIVITDLDGTMLNHHTYDSEAARTALVRCRQRGVPVILNTSKTYAETIEIRKQLGIDDPFIVENGSGIYYPLDRFADRYGSTRDGYREVICGCKQEEISDVLGKISTPADRYIRLSQCSVEQCVELTGLSAEQAEKAIGRDFSEPLIWQGDDEQLQVFITELEKHCLTTLQGGRFLHVIGQCNKGASSQQVRQAYGNSTRIIALGDSPNDMAMLAVADIACIVNSPSSEKLAQLVQADIKTSQQAPEGWVEAIDRAFGMIDQL